MALIRPKKLVPHALVLLCFLIIATLFCKPVLDGLVLNQHDIVGWKGMAQNVLEYKEKNGRMPLWNTNLFSGMPNYQIAMEGDTAMPNFVKIFSLGLPKPIDFLFVAAVCFYILTTVLGLSPWIGLFGGISYMLSTYNPIIIGVGHESKMWALAFLPILFAGVLALFEKRYWLGTALTVYGIFQQISVNHFQITYYALLIGIAVFIAYATSWVRNKEWKHSSRVLGIGIGAALLGLAGNALILLTTSEYSRYTMRGGKNLEIAGDTVKQTKTTGLDYDYASRYSISKAETVVLALPDAFGSSSSEPLDEESNVVSKLTERGVPETNARQITAQIPRYWGGIVEGTSGPPYVGAITCILALIGFTLLKSPLRWGLLAASIFSILLAWGKYFPSLNEFLFHNLPLYNKFRAPSMALTMVEFTLPVLAVLGLHQALYKLTAEELKKQFKPILYTTGGSLALILIMGLTMDYGNAFDEQIMQVAFDQSGSKEINQLIVAGLKQDRQDMYFSQTWRYAGFLAIVLLALYSCGRQWIKPAWAMAVLTLATTIDLYGVGKKYMGDDVFVEDSQYEAENFNPSPIDQLIKSDSDPHFRVFNMLSDPYSDSRTPYFHRSIGGYHPAKLRIYQDLIDRYLSNSINDKVLDMLDAKYILRQSPFTGSDTAIIRPTAMGAAWLVKGIQTTTDPVEGLQGIGSMNIRDSAIVEVSSNKKLTSAVASPDSTARIGLLRMDPDTLTYTFQSNQPQFAVFSEVFYPKGWNAYIDGKLVDYYKTNYALRGLAVPAGKHEIQFIFEPESFKVGNRIGMISSVLIMLIVFGSLFMAWRELWQQEKSA